MSTQNTTTMINRPVIEIFDSEEKEKDSKKKTGKTFGEFCKEGLIKPGMAVRFNNGSFDSIVLTHQQTGVKENQVISGILENGIVVKNKKGEMSIIVKALFTEKLTLYGRYAQAYGEQTLKDLTDSIINQVTNGKECNTIITANDSYDYYGDDSPLFEDYMCSPGNSREFFLTSGLYVKENSRSIYTGIPRAGETTSGYLLIELDANNLMCNLNNMIPQESYEPFSYTNNPFDMFVEID